MSTYEQILFDIQESLAIISFNRPDRLNAWTPVMEKEVADAVARAERDPSVRAIAFTGVGRGFCSGADLQAPRPADAPPRPGPDRFIFLWRATKPLVAAINGPAAGVGLSLTLYCDLRYIASDGSISTAFAQRGLIAEHGSAWLLPRLIGQQNAADLLYSGRKVAADEAAAMGLARMLPADGFIDQVKHLVGELVKRSSPRSLRVMRRQLQAAMSSDFEEALSDAHREQLESLQCADFREGIAAFRERRAAIFTGQ